MECSILVQSWCSPGVPLPPHFHLHFAPSPRGGVVLFCDLLIGPPSKQTEPRADRRGAVLFFGFLGRDGSGLAAHTDATLQQPTRRTESPQNGRSPLCPVRRTSKADRAEGALRRK